MQINLLLESLEGCINCFDTNTSARLFNFSTSMKTLSRTGGLSWLHSATSRDQGRRRIVEFAVVYSCVYGNYVQSSVRARGRVNQRYAKRVPEPRALVAARCFRASSSAISASRQCEYKAARASVANTPRVESNDANLMPPFDDTKSYRLCANSGRTSFPAKIIGSVIYVPFRLNTRMSLLGVLYRSPPKLPRTLVLFTRWPCSTEQLTRHRKFLDANAFTRPTSNTILWY